MRLCKVEGRKIKHDIFWPSIMPGKERGLWGQGEADAYEAVYS